MSMDASLRRCVPEVVTRWFAVESMIPMLLIWPDRVIVRGVGTSDPFAAPRSGCGGAMIHGPTGRLKCRGEPVAKPTPRTHQGVTTCDPTISSGGARSRG